MKEITICYACSKTMEVPDELITINEGFDSACPTDEHALIDYVIAHLKEDYEAFSLYENETGDFLAEF